MSWNWRSGDWAVCVFDPSNWFDDATGAPPPMVPARGEVLQVERVKVHKYRRRVWWKFWIPREEDVSLNFTGFGNVWFRAVGFRKIERADAIFGEAMRSLGRSPAKAG